MKSIVYIVLYFGKFPSIFPLWLNSCRNNPTIDWLIFTDDHSCFNYPQNVRVEYTSVVFRISKQPKITRNIQA